MLPMKPIPGVPDSSQVKPGMAYFADTGPYGTTCGQCRHRGYFRPSERWNKKTERYETRSIKHNGCAMYRKLAGKHGPVVEEEWRSCKYFERLPA